MSPRVRVAVGIGVAVLLALLLWLSRRGAQHAPMAREPAAIPSAPSVVPEAVQRAAPARTRPERGPGAPEATAHPRPPGGDDLMPRPGAVPPKDPDGPVRDWRDFTDDERAAVSGMELDMADMGDVVQRLEGGEEVGALRGAPVTAEEQAQLRAEVDAFAAAYEEAYDRAYGNETTVIEMSDAVRAARARFDRRVREIYGLADDQFYEIFPYRREL
jgi:hypothetical protein